MTPDKRTEKMTANIVNILAYQATITTQGQNYTGEKDWALNKLKDLFTQHTQDLINDLVEKLEGMKRNEQYIVNAVLVTSERDVERNKALTEAQTIIKSLTKE